MSSVPVIELRALPHSINIIIADPGGSITPEKVGMIAHQILAPHIVPNILELEGAPVA